MDEPRSSYAAPSMAGFPMFVLFRYAPLWQFDLTSELGDADAAAGLDHTLSRLVAGERDTVARRHANESRSVCASRASERRSVGGVIVPTTSLLATCSTRSEIGS